VERCRGYLESAADGASQTMPQTKLAERVRELRPLSVLLPELGSPASTRNRPVTASYGQPAKFSVGMAQKSPAKRFALGDQLSHDQAVDLPEEDPWRPDIRGPSPHPWAQSVGATNKRCSHQRFDGRNNDFD
jgi:hypothetical protein